MLSALGRTQEARQRLTRAEQLAPGVFGRMREDLAFRQFHPDLIAMVAQTLATLDQERPDRPPSDKLRKICTAGLAKAQAELLDRKKGVIVVITNGQSIA
jgi:hypothetical protein